MLISRGSLITAGNFKKVVPLNDKIQKYVNDNQIELS
jgi:hypothetical protein